MISIILYVYNLPVESFMNLPLETRVNPFDILFSQRSINTHFRNGTSVEYIIDELVNGTLIPDDIEKIRACYVNNQLHSLDNRRLHCYREAIRRGANYTTIPIRIISINDSRNNIEWKMDNAKFYTLVQHKKWNDIIIDSNSYPGNYEI